MLDLLEMVENEHIVETETENTPPQRQSHKSLENPVNLSYLQKSSKWMFSETEMSKHWLETETENRFVPS